MNTLFEIRRDDDTGEEYLETALTGQLLLEHPLLNKGSAFSDAERREFRLTGLLPAGVSSLELQLQRIYGNYRNQTTDLERYIHLTALQDRNETAFYALLARHLVEMMPIIYTPVVGLACQAYSRIYHRPRGLFISYLQKDRIDEVLANVVDPHIAVIVVTDGERILGLGDLGVGGMGIPIGKLSLYSVCAGIHPSTTLPIILDVGTNNEELLDDPLYIGWRHERIRGSDYDDFIDAFISAVRRRFPEVLLQWEDFAKHNASRLLERYRNQLCTFNDDIQGTGAVAVAAVMAAVAATGGRLRDQSIVLLGAGSAAMGIASQLMTALMSEGLTDPAARELLWLVDSQGLVYSQRADLDPFKRAHAQPAVRILGWDVAADGNVSLLEVVKQVRPTILIGTAAQPGAFSQAIVTEMARHVDRPIIFPLSNPTSRSEAVPTDLMHWTAGRALVATGSPFDDVPFGDRRIPIAQCNNAYIFPGVGLAVVACQARLVSDSMFVAAARTLSEQSPVHRDPSAPLLPPLAEVRNVSRRIAIAVAREAMRSGLAPIRSDAETEQRIDATMWQPTYLPYRRKT